MTVWTDDELKKIGAADELEIAPLRRDGTLRNRVTIWLVRVNDDIYVRSYNGPEGVWFRSAKVRHEGRIWAGGVEKDVQFVEESAPEINDLVDAAYLKKYGRYPQYVSPMVTEAVRTTTIKLVPRGA